MAEIVQLNLDEAPEVLVDMDVDGIVIIGGDSENETLESVRCLDWSLNHQLRRARQSLQEVPVFVPTMRKVRASFVVLAPRKQEKTTVVGYLANLGLKSVAVLSETGSLPDGWDNWSDSSFDKIILCSESDDSKDVDT